MTPQELLESIQGEVNPQKRLEKLLVAVAGELTKVSAAIITLVEMQKAKDQAQASAINTTINQFKGDPGVKVAEPTIDAPKQESLIKEEPQPPSPYDLSKRPNSQRRRRY